MSSPTLYTQTVPVWIKYLRNLSGIVAKAEKFCNENGIAQDEILSHRLADDMQGLPYQVQNCSNIAKFTIQRLGNTPAPNFEESTEPTFAFLQRRIAQTIELLETVDPQSMAGLESTEVIMETGMSVGDFRFETGQEYVSVYAMAKFHFHMTNAYCILRHRGVPIGGLDYMKDVLRKVEGS